MKDTIYIVFNRNGIRSLFKKTKGKGSLPAGTHMAELNLEVDNSFFEKQIPKFNLKLNEQNVIEKEVETERTPIDLFFSKNEEKDPLDDIFVDKHSEDEEKVHNQIAEEQESEPEIKDGCLNCKQSFRDDKKVLRCKLNGMTMTSCSRECFEGKDINFTGKRCISGKEGDGKC